MRLLEAHLNDDCVSHGVVGVDLGDFGATVAKVEPHDATVDVVLTVNLGERRRKSKPLMNH